MFSLQKPDRAAIDRFIREQSTLDFSYPHVGAAAGPAPAGFVLDDRTTWLGQGEGTFARASETLKRWRHFALGWVQACWPETPIERGQTVAILAHTWGLWSLNACRIIEVLDERNAEGWTFGFVYGTLPGHVESGEERFVIRWNRADNRVSYTIRAFSRPNHVLARVGYPIVRRQQKRFAIDSSAAMVRHCSAEGIPSAM